jgi:hypothetical protein
MTKTKTLMSLIVILVAAAIGVSAAAGDNAEGVSSGNQLTGTWQVTVNRGPLPTLTSLQVFTDDGSMVEHASDGSANRSPAFGSWVRLEGRLYSATSVFLRFNPLTGAYLGTHKVRRTIRVSEDGQSFTSVARGFILDPDGNVIAPTAATTAGTRMEVENIPEQP